MQEPIKNFDLPIKGLNDWFDIDVAIGKRGEIANLIKKLMRETDVNVSVDDLPDINLPH